MQAMEEEEASANWLQQHLKASYEPLLQEPMRFQLLRHGC